MWKCYSNPDDFRDFLTCLPKLELLKWTYHDPNEDAPRYARVHWYIPKEAMVCLDVVKDTLKEFHFDYEIEPDQGEDPNAPKKTFKAGDEEEMLGWLVETIEFRALEKVVFNGEVFVTKDGRWVLEDGQHPAASPKKQNKRSGKKKKFKR